MFPISLLFLSMASFATTKSCLIYNIFSKSPGTISSITMSICVLDKGHIAHMSDLGGLHEISPCKPSMNKLADFILSYGSVAKYYHFLTPPFRTFQQATRFKKNDIHNKSIVLIK